MTPLRGDPPRDSIFASNRRNRIAAALEFNLDAGKFEFWVEQRK